ncbi:gamma-glutamylcyclotransferase family protein [Inhella crocodyli]|uniref:Gamma-glutamylcyclotransferase n=1 Tax=Inhella crocodyli TaxID=2499851 RepID=A0A3S2UEH9_9BURK|nr:gamma-glutamylcyclotransferase family protein [Inhella crocodyli]RVT83645.1 gamma-glutamylcyclotransferase [Inhella crocodyli]
MAFWYFGYGSNMNLTALRAKGVQALASCRAELPGWRLRFNVEHFFRHEGGVGNVEPSAHPGDRVCGVLHRCEDEALGPLDATEACGHGYHRVEVTVHTDQGQQSALTYVGDASFLNEACLPTQRYLNIVLRGAEGAGLDPAYVAALRAHPVMPAQPVAPFAPPAGDWPALGADALAGPGPLTALAGHVFDMGTARPRHEYLKGFFGGKDMTFFHLQRMDSSDGREDPAAVAALRFTPAQQRYLDQYLWAYLDEYRYVGRLAR